MAKVISKLQVSIPNGVGDQYRIAPGDELKWAPSGDAIRLVPSHASQVRFSKVDRLRLFDQATDWQRTRDRVTCVPARPPARGWTRSELYSRSRSS